MIFPVCECRLRYRAPARYDDVLDICVWITRAKGVRLNVAHRILHRLNLETEGDVEKQEESQDAEPAKPKAGEEKKGVEGAVSVGVETETKREEGKTKTEAIRCLKRYVARELYACLPLETLA